MNSLLYRYYKILEIDPQADFAEVKRAYHDLVWVWHPDRFPQNESLQQKAHHKLKQINEAYDALKKHYNQKNQSHTANQQAESKQNNHSTSHGYSQSTKNTNGSQQQKNSSSQSNQKKWEEAFNHDSSTKHQEQSSTFDRPSIRRKRMQIYSFVLLVIVIEILLTIPHLSPVKRWNMPVYTRPQHHSVIVAALEEYNSLFNIGPALRTLRSLFIDPIEKDFDVFSQIPEPYQRAEFYGAYLKANSPEEVNTITKEIQRHIENQETLSQYGFGTNLALGVVAGITDPIHWFWIVLIWSLLLHINRSRS